MSHFCDSVAMATTFWELPQGHLSAIAQSAWILSKVGMPNRKCYFLLYSHTPRVSLNMPRNINKCTAFTYQLMLNHVSCKRNDGHKDKPFNNSRDVYLDISVVSKSSHCTKEQKEIK